MPINTKFEFDFEQFVDLVKFVSVNIKNITEYFTSSVVQPRFKEDMSPVTMADISIERMFVEHITTSMPLCSVLGEESGLSGRKDSRYKWIIDPIDGTQSFIHGVPLYSTLIAYTVDDIPQYGAIYLPTFNKLLVGDNNVALLDGKEVTMRQCNSISEATILTSGTRGFYKYRDPDKFMSLTQRAKCFRTWGDGYGYYLLATGKADIMVDPHTSVWDSSAIIPIIRGAGGIITDYYGKDPVGKDSMVAVNAQLHQEVIEALS